VRVRVGNGHDPGLGQTLIDALVIFRKKNALSFLSGPPTLPPYWFLLNGGLGLVGSSKNWRAIECTVAHEVERRSVDDVGARPGDRVDHRATAAKLRAVGISSRSGTRNGFDSERGASTPEPAARFQKFATFVLSIRKACPSGRPPATEYTCCRAEQRTPVNVTVVTPGDSVISCA